MVLYKLFQFLLWLPARILLPTKVYGKRNLKKGGKILVSNHQSMLDIPILGLYISSFQHFLGKKELFKKGGFFEKLGGISIDREKPELSAFKKCLGVLKNNQTLTIFPEGTRHNKYPLENFKSGSAMFAIKSKKPIFPMWIEKKPKFFKFNVLRIGKQVDLDEFYDKKLDETLLKQAENKIFYSMKNLMCHNTKPTKKSKCLI